MSGNATDLSVAEALEQIGSGGLSADEWFDAYASRPDSVDAYLWRAESGAASPDSSAPDGPLGSVPVAVKDLFAIDHRRAL